MDRGITMELLPDLSKDVEVVEADRELDALRYLQQVYRGVIEAEGPRMRAAIACLPFETPRLSIMANVDSKDMAERLERAIARSGIRPVIEHSQVQAPKVIEAPQPSNVTGPMPGTDRKMRRL
jgi:hypothetical protein